MKVSLNTIKQYIDFDLPSVDELVARINAQLGGVEEVIDLGAKYKDARIVKVVECEKHPDADKLSICKVDDGGVVQDVLRDDNGLVQVVCGAPNVHADMWAVWLSPRSTVPASFDDEEPFVLDARKLRGVPSQGMLAAGDELAINSNHEGIIEITERDLPADKAIAAGASFAEVFGLDDVIIDIENKMFTHRPDLFGQLGVAREIAGIYRQQFTSPEWYRGMEDGRWKMEDGVGVLPLEVTNEAPNVVPRLMAVVIRNVEITPSPLWLQCELVRLGGKPINNIVDATNYSMLLTAQPTHAYDYDKLRGHKLVSRMACSGETIQLLNGKTYELNENDIVIADGEGPVGLAGIMGGGESEVSEETKNIVLEVANFDMYAVRRSAMRHGVFTDALTRFNKGQSPRQNPVVLAHLIGIITRLAGGEQASNVFDEHAPDFDEASYQPVSFSEEFISARLGLGLSREEIQNLLENVELTVFTDTDITITQPFWRTDLELPEDIVEEVGRLYGYDKLPRELPLRSTRPTPANKYRELTHQVRQSLARAGANEVLTYSFVHERVLRAAGQDPGDAYQLSNALSPDLHYYRLSLTPSLLDKVHANIKSGYDEFALFEIGKSHSKKAGFDSEGLPVEPGRIALAYAAKTARAGAPYYKAKQLLEYMANELHLTLEYKPLPAGTNLTAAAPFAAGRTARVIDRTSGQVIGIVGEYAPAVRKAYKLPDYAAGFELFTEGLALAAPASDSTYTPLSKYPSVLRDVCFEVANDVSYAALIAAVHDAVTDIAVIVTATPIDLYQGNDDKKRITLRLTVTSHDTTLTSEAATDIVGQITTAVQDTVDATVV